MKSMSWMHGPECPHCGGRSTRAVRTRGAQVSGQSIYYLTYVWACDVCGRESLDEALTRLNQWSAEGAFLTASYVNQGTRAVDAEHDAW